MSGVAGFGTLSVVIPAYNASRYIVDTIASVRGWLGSQGLDAELIVVDDDSGDDTATLAGAEAGVTLLRHERNRGKGAAVRTGVLAARGDWIVFMDADNATTIDHLERFAERLDGADVLIASRRLEDSKIAVRQPKLRQMLGRSFPHLVRVLALPDISDTQCGFKLFRRDAAQAIFGALRVERFAFDVEVLLLARRLGLRIVEVPVDWHNPPGSTVRISVDVAQMLFDVVRSALRHRGRRSAP